MNIDSSIYGHWVRIGPAGPISLNFKSNGLVEGDFGNDKTIDVFSEYNIKNDTISFLDKKGQECQGFGKYKIYKTDYHIAFDLIEDNCGGRVKSTMGYWVKPNFNDLLAELNNEIAKSPKPEFHLNRARMYMAIGKPKQAKLDFDSYIKYDTTNAIVFINRAGTRFPNDLEGVVTDCNKAIALQQNSKNAFFLRGLALYDLGKKEQACADFNKAIELGFSILRVAEKEKCSEYWKSNSLDN